MCDYFQNVYKNYITVIFKVQIFPWNKQQHDHNGSDVLRLCQAESGVHLYFDAYWRSVVSEVVEGELGQVGKA